MFKKILSNQVNHGTMQDTKQFSVYKISEADAEFLKQMKKEGKTVMIDDKLTAKYGDRETYPANVEMVIDRRLPKGIKFAEIGDTLVDTVDPVLDQIPDCSGPIDPTFFSENKGLPDSGDRKVSLNLRNITKNKDEESFSDLDIDPKEYPDKVSEFYDKTFEEVSIGDLPLTDMSAPFGVLPDSGGRRVFDTGSVRDVREGKGRYDLLSPFVTRADAILMEKGAIKYDARNWEKGQPVMSFYDSAKRHMDDYVQCLLLGEEEAEDHLAAVRWNIGGMIHVLEMIRRGLLPVDLDDRPGPQPKLKGRVYNDQRNVKRGVDG